MKTTATTFKDVERVHAPDDGGCSGYYRLDIVVHGHQSRPQELLPYRHYEIAEESSEYKHVGQLGILCQGDGTPSCQSQTSGRYGYHDD